MLISDFYSCTPWISNLDGIYAILSQDYAIFEMGAVENPPF
jgi:hypothetical protein